MDKHCSLYCVHPVLGKHVTLVIIKILLIYFYFKMWWMWYLYLDVVVLACTCTWECYLQVLILTRLSYWKCKHIIFYFATTIQITGNFMPLPYIAFSFIIIHSYDILCICCNLCKWFEFFMHLQQFESCCVCNIQLHCLFSSCYFCFFFLLIHKCMNFWVKKK